MKSSSIAVLGTMLIVFLLGCKENNADKGLGELKTNVDVIQNDQQKALLGRYGLLSDGKIVPFLRIMPSSLPQELVMQEWGAGNWQGTEAAGHPLTAEERRKLTDVGLPDSAIPVRFGKMILVKVAKSDAGKLGGSTGFALLTEIGPIELTPMS